MSQTTDYFFLEPIDSPEALDWAENWSGATADKLEGAHRAGLRDRLLSPLNTDD